MYKLYNNSERNYVHTLKEGNKFVTYRLKPKSDLLVPDEVAKIWLKSKEIMELGAQNDEKDKEIERLKAELAKTKGKEEEEVAPMSLDELRARAKELKIKGYANAKAETLIKKIAEAEMLLASE